MNFSLVHRDGGVGHLLVADVACLLQFLVDTLDVFVQVGNCQSLSTVRTLRTLIVVHLSNVPTQVAHCELLLTMRTRFLNPLVRLSHMSGKVINTNVLLAVRAVGLLTQVDTLDVVVQELFCLELLFAIRTLVIPDLLVEVFHMVVEVLVFLVADVTSRSLTQMNLLNVVFQGVLGDKLLLAETALSDFVVTVLFQDMPSEVSNWERLVAELAFNFLTMVCQDVFIQVGNLTKMILLYFLKKEK